MEKYTKHSIQWFYNLIAQGECDILDFKEYLSDKNIFGKPYKSYAPKYDELAKDVVAFANKKGGFIFLGIADESKEINVDFTYDNKNLFDLVSQIQNRTSPSITLQIHKLRVNETDLALLEIPFSKQLHRTSKSEYLIRSNDGNRAIEPHEISTIQSEKDLIVFDQKTWQFNLVSTESDVNGMPVPGWQDINKARSLYNNIKNNHPKSSYLKNSSQEFNETLGLIKEVDGHYLPTTTGLLFIGNAKALKELPFNQIKYIRYYEDGTYTPFEYKGDLITIVDQCFAQLVAEKKVKEFHFGLFREYIEDYSEIVLRELLINAVAHRDYSRQQIIEIRKYPSYIEFESPGRFPQGVDETNFLRKTNPRNPNIMDVLREINYAEKAGSGFDKIFTALLSKGKSLPIPQQTEDSIIIRVEADVHIEKLAELSILYKQLTGIDIDFEKLIVLNYIYSGQKMTLSQLENSIFVNKYQLKRILTELLDLELIETTGRTSDLKYIIHKSRLESTEDKITYSKQKKQEKARQIEAILRYLDSVGEIENEGARKLLNIPDTNAPFISRLFNEMMDDNLIEIAYEKGHNKRVYKRKTT
ncbi:MAG: putative DNA binding domain-containing protein [Saprospiraceae bacterium]|nr:putative DNA binding domain-containing protein [Saprospiraceae bacterium]